MDALSAADIAEAVGGVLVGSRDLELSGVAALDDAGPGDVSFLANPKYRSQVLLSAAGLVLVPHDFDEAVPQGRAWLKCDKPSVAFSQVALTFLPEIPPPSPGVDPAATVAPTASLGKDVHIGPQAVISAEAVIGDGSIVEAGCFVGIAASIGVGCRLYPNVSVRERTKIADRVIIHCGAVIGSDGFGYEPDPDGGPHLKLPQLGIVQIDDDVEIGACTTIDRARFGRTWIQRNVKIDNLVQVAHNVVVGEGSFLMAQVAIAGSSRVGKLVAMYGRSGLPGHLTVGDRAMLMGTSVPYGNVEAGAHMAGTPARPQKQHLREMAALSRLPDLLKQVKRLEARVAELEGQSEAE